MKTRTLPLAAGTAALLVAIVGCAGPSSESAAPTPSASCDGVDAVTAIMSNPFSVVQYYGFYLLGVEQGFFADECIDLTIQEGNGSATSAQVIAAGNAQFGLNIGLVAVVNNNENGAGLKIVGRDSAVATYAVVSLDAEISEPEDLVGRTIGLPEGTTQGLLWPAFLEAAGVDPASVSTVNVSPANAVTTLAQGRVDGIVTYTNSSIPALSAIGEDDATALLFSDYDITVVPDAGIVTTDALIESDPDLVARFVAAAEKSIQYALDHPDEIYAAGSAVYPDAFTEEIVLGQGEISGAALEEFRVEGEPYVFTPLDQLADTLVLLRSAGVITSDRQTSFYATNDFVPGER